MICEFPPRAAFGELEDLGRAGPPVIQRRSASAIPLFQYASQAFFHATRQLKRVLPGITDQSMPGNKPGHRRHRDPVARHRTPIEVANRFVTFVDGE